ncbi:DNA/RNA nuclease SfsA [Desulfosudis oleivorans]|uniref:Sugar fermentation stimulation protein homolog n=1 Tax=Desulfosudis oleivorans (strain DSM 6200 / JCM 39069 / Hxd3) TaxID=96561 RepID=A8ZTW9_DESOH|nr:DNA/RNA nuclease SfsA [Desulfosudis oleivorans]ABW67902.1 sugar fermentation stimulation protein [Desulfosudis oleivorans Hxd3]
MAQKEGVFWPPLIKGTLIKRYKRFLADVRLGNNRMVTAHCPNSGSMKACCEPGRPVYISRQNSPARKLKYTWELIDMPGSLVGVNTGIPNALVRRSIEKGYIHPLKGYDRVTPEVKTSAHTRLDLMLENTKTGGRCYVEVKNCTLVENRTASFPDAVTERGKKHLLELQGLAANGHRCAMVFLIQRMDATTFRPADPIDPAYGRTLREVARSGVELYAYDVNIDLERIIIGRRIKIVL